MDYPILRKGRYNVSNNYWFLPTDLFQTVQEQENKDQTVRKSPILTYLDQITRKEKFKYFLIALIVILFVYRLNLHWTIWMGIPVGLFVVYYLNEREAQELNRVGDHLWNVVKSPLLKNTKYFITDPPMIQWVNDVGDLKKYNILEFNQMITSLDRMLKLIYDIKLGVTQCKENLDLILDLKITSLNQFHSLVYKINNADLREKYNYYLEQLGFLLNERHSQLVKMCQWYYLMKPINIDSRLDVTLMDEPTPHDTTYNPHYNFYH